MACRLALWAGMGPKPESGRRRLLWLVALAGIGAWIATIGGLILAQPAAGAASPAELAKRTAAAVNGRDAAALAGVLAEPLDEEFAAAFLSRLDDARAAEVLVERGPGDLLRLRGHSANGRFEFSLVTVTEDGRWFLSPLPPI